MCYTGYVTRIAPSPTGDMHLGTARTAYFNWLVARASGGVFLLRIDDTDLERNRDECIRVIRETMDWLGLVPDMTFSQSEKVHEHKQMAYKLRDEGKAITLDNGAIALKWPDNMPDRWEDQIAGPIKITDTNKEQVDGRLILLRGGDKLGQPTYQFASIIDDYLSGVNYIIRGVDHITNTAKQIAIWRALDANTPIPKFAHVGLVTKDKKKLSKRDAAASMLQYRDKGYHPEAMLNFMLRLGWGPTKDDKSAKIINRSKAIELFLNGGSMKNSPAGFDEAKLISFNKWYKRNEISAT